MKADIVRVMEEKWDHLIILDACRYDYFSKIYQNYFLGELRKAISIGSGTPEWCKNSFQGFYPDVIYISGGPYVNSKQEIGGFCARDHFFKVVDVWNFGWSRKLNAVPPWKINRYALNFIENFPEKRFIIHYLQPHEPYISRYFSDEDVRKRYSNALKWNQEIWTRRQTSLEKLLRFLFVRTKLAKNTWKVRELLNLPPMQPMDAVRRKYGIDGLRKAYEMNLAIVLEYVSRLCHELLCLQPNKSIVITADHGELLGEGGHYCHPSGSRNPILREVPFFRVKYVKARPRDVLRGIIADEAEEPEEPFTKEEEERIRTRLRALGYID